MVAVGAVIELGNTGKILINQRGSDQDWQPNEWEITYGRIDQFEGLDNALKREVEEEVGIENLEVLSVLTAWHIFRGSEKNAQNELIGITYHCRTRTENVRLSSEHSAYKWVLPEEALNLVSVDGIRRDIEKFAEVIYKNK